MEEEPRLVAWERRTETVLTASSLLFLVLYAIQVLATRRGEALHLGLDVALWVLYAVFVADYLVRLTRARRRWWFVRTHPVDLLVVLAPFFRALRVLSAVSVLGRMLSDDFRGKVATYLVSAVALFGTVSALAVYEAEREAPDASITSFGEALWWVATTITTVGYGDRYPVTLQGRLVAVGLMVAGIAVLGTVTATIATWFVARVGESSAAAVAAEEARDAVTSAELAEVLAELRVLRARLDALEPRRSDASDVTSLASDARNSTSSR